MSLIFTPKNVKITAREHNAVMTVIASLVKTQVIKAMLFLDTLSNKMIIVTLLLTLWTTVINTIY